MTSPSTKNRLEEIKENYDGLISPDVHYLIDQLEQSLALNARYKEALEFYCDSANAQLDEPYEITEKGFILFGTTAKEALQESTTTPKGEEKT
jgi:hypothetical protein